jgi:hypothetical protein
MVHYLDKSGGSMGTRYVLKLIVNEKLQVIENKHIFGTVGNLEKF